MKKQQFILKIAIVGIIAILVLQACGAPKSHCKTRGKTRVEMGFM